MMITSKRKNYQVCNDDNDDERSLFSYDNKVVVAIFVMSFKRELSWMRNRCNKAS